MYSSQFKIDKKVTFILQRLVQRKNGTNYPQTIFGISREPLFYSSLKIAYESKLIDEIIIVTNEENLEYMKNFAKKKE